MTLAEVGLYMKKLIVAACAALLVCACSSAPTDSSPSGVSAPIADLPRSLTGGEQKIISAANDFSWALFARVANTPKDVNVFVSPLSASMSLAMAMNGTANSTYDQMRTTLAYGSATDAEINGSYKSAIALLRSLDNTTDIRIANSIWYDKAFQVKQTFIDVSKASFDASVTPLDFKSAASVATINDWVNTATVGAIPKIIDQIDASQVMFLINAIYFKGSWRQKFDPAETVDAPFHGIAGDETMKLMHRIGALRFVYRSDLAAAEIFYGDSAFSMTVVMPQGTATIDNVASQLTNNAAWTALLAQMNTAKRIDLFLPRLKLEWERKLKPDLVALGMRDAFSDGIADFSRLTTQSVVISEVKQKTYVDINEEGTTAAAVTNTEISVTSATPQFRVERPFIFVIRERLTGTILFMGKIVRMP